MWMPVASTRSQNAPRALQRKCAACEGGQVSCPKCAEGDITAQDAYTYTFISRGSYGETTPGFTRPSCVASAAGTSTLVAGSAAPTVTVFPNGTYEVRRNDGVVKTATCARLAAGLAATLRMKTAMLLVREPELLLQTLPRGCRGTSVRQRCAKRPCLQFSRLGIRRLMQHGRTRSLTGLEPTRLRREPLLRNMQPVHARSPDGVFHEICQD